MNDNLNFNVGPVYHGSITNDPKFNNLSFFSTDPTHSENYGKHITKYYLSIKTPFDITTKKDFNNLLTRVKVIIDPYDETEYRNFKDLTNTNDTWEITENYIDQIKSMRYDSIIIYEGGIKNYAVFNQTQIKPADIRENELYKSYQEVIEEDWKSALRRGAVAAGIGGAAALGLNSLHNKPLPTHSPTPSNHISVSTPKRVSAADIDAKLKAQHPTQPEVKSATPAPAPKPSTKDSNRAELRTIDIIINIIMSHEGLEPKQTPVRITSRKMRNWDHVLGFDIDKNYQRDPARGNFFYLQDASKVDDLIKKIFRLYSIYPQKYGLPRKPTLKQCIHKFDQTGAKGKIAYLKKKLPTLNIDTPIENFFL